MSISSIRSAKKSDCSKILKWIKDLAQEEGQEHKVANSVEDLENCLDSAL